MSPCTPTIFKQLSQKTFFIFYQTLKQDNNYNKYYVYLEEWGIANRNKSGSVAKVQHGNRLTSSRAALNKLNNKTTFHIEHFLSHLKI